MRISVLTFARPRLMSIPKTYIILNRNYDLISDQKVCDVDLEKEWTIKKRYLKSFLNLSEILLMTPVFFILNDIHEKWKKSVKRKYLDIENILISIPISWINSHRSMISYKIIIKKYYIFVRSCKMILMTDFFEREKGKGEIITYRIHHDTCIIDWKESNTLLFEKYVHDVDPIILFFFSFILITNTYFMMSHFDVPFINRISVIYFHNSSFSSFDINFFHSKKIWNRRIYISIRPILSI